MQLLDRLHYKGRNQHRPAPFWKKIQEMRRISRLIIANIKVSEQLKGVDCKLVYDRE
jgi:hypothetical protein